MFAKPQLSPSQAADRLRRAAQLIREAGALLDEVVSKSPRQIGDRVEIIPGQDQIDGGVSGKLAALAADLEAEEESTLSATEAECIEAELAQRALEQVP
jgi:hypothetical protein